MNAIQRAAVQAEVDRALRTGEWVVYFDKASGRSYYSNSETKTVVWDLFNYIADAAFGDEAGVVDAVQKQQQQTMTNTRPATALPSSANFDSPDKLRREALRVLFRKTDDIWAVHEREMVLLLRVASPNGGATSQQLPDALDGDEIRSVFFALNNVAPQPGIVRLRSTCIELFRSVPQISYARRTPIPEFVGRWDIVPRHPNALYLMISKSSHVFSIVKDEIVIAVFRIIGIGSHIPSTLLLSTKKCFTDNANARQARLCAFVEDETDRGARSTNMLQNVLLSYINELTLKGSLASRQASLRGSSSVQAPTGVQRGYADSLARVGTSSPSVPPRGRSVATTTCLRHATPQRRFDVNAEAAKREVELGASLPAPHRRLSQWEQRLLADAPPTKSSVLRRVYARAVLDSTSAARSLPYYKEPQYSTQFLRQTSRKSPFRTTRAPSRNPDVDPDGLLDELHNALEANRTPIKQQHSPSSQLPPQSAFTSSTVTPSRLQQLSGLVQSNEAVIAELKMVRESLSQQLLLHHK